MVSEVKEQVWLNEWLTEEDALAMVFEVLRKYRDKESEGKLSLRLAAYAYQRGREDQKADKVRRCRLTGNPALVSY